MFKIAYWLAYILLFPIYRFHFVGKENIPSGACLLCANHTANIDAVLMIFAGGAKGDYGFMAKEELFRVPVLRLILRGVHAFPVKRGKSDISALKACFSILQSGRKLMLFPEGTRVHPGESVEPKTGAAMLALRNGVPVVPVYIPAGRKAFRKNIIVIGQPIHPVVEGKPGQKEYQALTGTIMTEIRRLSSGGMHP